MSGAAANSLPNKGENSVRDSYRHWYLEKALSFKNSRYQSSNNSAAYHFYSGIHSRRPDRMGPSPSPQRDGMRSSAYPCCGNRDFRYPTGDPIYQHGSNRAKYTPDNSYSYSMEPPVGFCPSRSTSQQSRVSSVPAAGPFLHSSSSPTWKAMDAILPTPTPGRSPEQKIPTFVYPRRKQHRTPSLSPLPIPPSQLLPGPSGLVESTSNDDIENSSNSMNSSNNNSSNNSNNSPLSASLLASASPEAQKEMIGDRLHQKIFQSKPALAGRITGILLESDNCYELLNLLESPEELLRDKIDEVLHVLESHWSPQVVVVSTSGGSGME